jgi:hypothetical protein
LQLDLSGNQLCGVNECGEGTYTAEGITAIADALRVNGAVTVTNLLGNQLRDEGWGAIFAAICGNKDSKIMSLDASFENIGPAGVKLIAEALRTSITGALTVTNLLGNQLDAESAKMLAEVAKQKGISLCGIRRDQTTADFRNKYLEPADAILLASDLSQAVVTGGLTALDLSSSDLNDEGVSAVCEAILSNKEIELASLSMVETRIGPVGAKSVAAMVAVTGGLTALDLSFNELKDEGVSAVCEAILSNKETKLASLSMVETRIGPVGAKSVAAMVAVTGALTECNLKCNPCIGENAYRGTYAAEGITAIADALCVNGALTECNLKCNPCIGEEGEALIRKAMQGKAGFKLRI